MSFLPDIFAKRSFSLAEFELAPLDFTAEITAELAELLLDQPIHRDESSNVVPLARRIPTPGEMRESIELHLEAQDKPAQGSEAASPAEELRLALAELRRSLG